MLFWNPQYSVKNYVVMNSLLCSWVFVCLYAVKLLVIVFSLCSKASPCLVAVKLILFWIPFYAAKLSFLNIRDSVSIHNVLFPATGSQWIGINHVLNEWATRPSESKADLEKDRAIQPTVVYIFLWSWVNASKIICGFWKIKKVSWQFPDNLGINFLLV